MGPGARGNKAGVREYVVGASVLTPGIGGTVKPESTKSGLMRFNMSHEDSLYVVSAFASKLTCKNKTNTNTPIKLTVLLHIHAK